MNKNDFGIYANIVSNHNQMNKEKLPLITALLRAARNQDEDTMRWVLENVTKNGIRVESINAVDCSGRVSNRKKIK